MLYLEHVHEQVWGPRLLFSGFFVPLVSMEYANVKFLALYLVFLLLHTNAALFNNMNADKACIKRRLVYLVQSWPTELHHMNLRALLWVCALLIKRAEIYRSSPVSAKYCSPPAALLMDIMHVAFGCQVKIGLSELLMAHTLSVVYINLWSLLRQIFLLMLYPVSNNL